MPLGSYVLIQSVVRTHDWICDRTRMSTLRSVDMHEAWKRINEALESDVALEASGMAGS